MVGNGFAGLSARTFYVGRGFDAQQILIAMLPHDHSTLLYTVHRSLGEKIGGVRQALRRPRLHAQMEQAVIQVVESFRSGAALAR